MLLRLAKPASCSAVYHKSHLLIFLYAMMLPSYSTVYDKHTELQGAMVSPPKSPVHPICFAVSVWSSFLHFSLHLVATHPLKCCLEKLALHCLQNWQLPPLKEMSSKMMTMLSHGLPIFASRKITRLKANPGPQGKEENVISEEVHYILKDLSGFSN